MLEFDFAKTEFFVRVVAFARFIKYHYFGLVWVNRETGRPQLVQNSLRQLRSFCRLSWSRAIRMRSSAHNRWPTGILLSRGVMAPAASRSSLSSWIYTLKSSGLIG